MSNSGSILKALNKSNSVVVTAQEGKNSSPISSDSPIQSEMKDEFCYDEINHILFNKIRNNEAARHPQGNYTAYVQINSPEKKDFIYFENNNAKPKKFSECSDVGILFKIYGLKFHISLPEQNENMRKIGWKVIKDILIEKQITEFKILKKGEKMSKDEEQRGKDVTIYANLNPDLRTKDWQALLQQITQELVKAGVSPGYRCPDDKNKPEKPVQGSNYITYRYHDESSSRHNAMNQIALRKLADKTHQDTGEINGWPKYDAIALVVRVVVANQPNIPDFTPEKSIDVSENSDNKMDSNQPK